jgi:hypothetical protein
MAQKEIITQKHVQSLAQELAHAAGITTEQANKVLEVLHVNKLNENVVAMHELLSNEKAVNALGLSGAHAKDRLSALAPEALTLSNMRLGFKQSGAVASIVV